MSSRPSPRLRRGKEAGDWYYEELDLYIRRQECPWDSSTHRYSVREGGPGGREVGNFSNLYLVRGWIRDQLAYEEEEP